MKEALQEQVDELNEMNAAMEGRIDELIEEIGTKSAELGLFEVANKALEDASRALQDEKAKALERIAELESSASLYKAEDGILNARLDALQDRYDADMAAARASELALQQTFRDLEETHALKYVMQSKLLILLRAVYFAMNHTFSFVN
jgi:chromosome segregation ATPase